MIRTVLRPTSLHPSSTPRMRLGCPANRWAALRRFAVPLALLALVACGESATSPDDGASEFDPVELSLDRIDRGDRAPTGERELATLQRLLHDAVDEVREERGPEAVRRMLAPLRSLLETARTARQAGDHRAARRAMREANLVAARIVIRVLGTGVLETLHGDAEAAIGVLKARLDAGQAQNPAQLALLINRLEDRLALATRLQAAGALPAALLHLAGVIDMARAGGSHL